MKHCRWLGPIVLMIAGNAGAEELKSGIWMLEIYNPRAPLQTIRLAIETAVDAYTVEEMDGGELQIDNLRLVDDEVWFDHLILEESCLLRLEQASGAWEGTCPPNQELKFDGGLTVTLREPRGGGPTPEVESENLESTAEAEPELNEEGDIEDSD